MSTNYTDTLKRIKDAEETSNREVAEKKKALEAELHEIEQVADKSIELAKGAAETYITKETNAARQTAQAEAKAMLDSTRKRAEDIASKKLEKKEFRKIIDEILFSEFKSD